MQPSNKGFTLVEIMVVVALVAALALMSSPNLVTAMVRYRIRTAARELSQAMRKARWQAIKEKRKVRMVFNQSRGTYEVGGRVFPLKGSLAEHYGSGVAFGFGRATRSAAASGGRLPRKLITFQGSPPRLTFNAYGVSNPGSVYLTNSRRESYAVVVSTSGRIRMRRWKGNKWH